MSEPVACGCGMPTFEIVYYDDAYHAECNCERGCGQFAYGDGKTPIAALDAAIVAWNQAQKGDRE